MIRYLKLVHYEFIRFYKIYLSLFLVTLLSQFAGVYLFTQKYMEIVNNNMVRESFSNAEYMAKYGVTNFTRFSNGSLWFVTPIALCAAGLLLYVFLIWYRDWSGKNMFIYRLLMLPTARNNVYLAKASVILLLVWGLIAFQLLILPLQNVTFNTLVPSEFRDTLSVNDIILNHPILNILIPQSFTEFALYYGAGLLGVTVVFTAILIERSYRLKGLIGGIVYCIAVGFVLLLPVIISEKWFQNYLYPNELIMIEAVVGILIFCASLRFSSFLLNKKVTV